MIKVKIQQHIREDAGIMGRAIPKTIEKFVIPYKKLDDYALNYIAGLFVGTHQDYYPNLNFEAVESDERFITLWFTEDDGDGLVLKVTQMGLELV